MNGIARCMVAGLFALVLSSCSCPPSKASDTTRPDSAPSVSDIIKSVQTVIDSFYQEPGAEGNLPPLKSVKLTLQTVLDNKAAGEADYLLVALKGYNESAHTQQLDVILTPEQPQMAIESRVAQPSIADALKQAIQNARNQIQRTYASKIPGHSLNTSEVDVQISFAVTWDGSAGVNKWVLLPITLTGSEEVSNKTTHTITVAFANPVK